MNTIDQIISNITNWIVLPFFTGLAVVIFIYAGILFAISNGDPGKITRARQAVIIAIVGIIIGVAAKFAEGFIKYLLGV